LLSVFIAALIIFTQKNYKRLLAYSSIENMGIIAIGFGFGGIGIFAAIFHMIYHSLTKSALFLSAGSIFLKYSSTKIINVRGVITALPLTAILFLTGFFAITGTPPFGIFMTKIFIILAGMQSHPFASIVAILLTAILFVGFFQHVIAMTFGKKPDEIQSGEISIWLVLPPLTLLTVVLILSFYVPPFLFKLITTAVSQY
jgi:hydrogenase-4 component F